MVAINKCRVLGLAVFALIGQASSQSFPVKPVTLIHPFGAGSGADQSARVLAEEFGKLAGVPLVVDARPGGNSMIGMQAVKRSPADGYTVMLTTNTTQVHNALLFKDLPLDPVADFVPVAGQTIIYQAMVVAAESPVNNYGEFIALARKKPGMTFGSGTAVGRMAGEIFRQMAKLDLLNVPYKATPAVMIDLIGGRVDVTFAALVEVTAMVRAGKVKPLAVTSPKRIATMAEVPTLDELGLKGYENGVWSGIFAPVGTPEPVVRRLSELFLKANASPVMDKFRAPTSAQILALDGPSLAKFQAADIARARSAAQAAGIVPE